MQKRKESTRKSEQTVWKIGPFLCFLINNDNGKQTTIIVCRVRCHRRHIRFARFDSFPFSAILPALATSFAVLCASLVIYHKFVDRLMRFASNRAFSL